MSGLAFSTLALFCALIPGFVFQFIYYRVTAQSETTGRVDLTSVKPLVLAVLFSLPTHAVWVGAINLFDAHIAPIGAVDFYNLLPILQGEPLAMGSTLASRLDGWSIFNVALYISSQAAFALVAGRQLALWGDRNGWPKSRALSSDGALWHRLLAYPDEEPDGVVVSATVTLGQETYLYFGLLSEYSLTPSGELKNLVLEFASRRVISKPAEETYDLPGEYFVLNCKNIETVDIDYFWLVPKDEDSDEASEDGETIFIDTTFEGD